MDAVSAGPISILVMGAHTNLGIFVMSNPELKKNVKHIYAMGGAVDSTMSGEIGNLFPQHSNPFAEFNIFADPFAAYTVTCVYIYICIYKIFSNFVGKRPFCYVRQYHLYFIEVCENITFILNKNNTR